MRRRLLDKSNQSDDVKKEDTAHLTVTHKAAGQSRDVIPSWKVLSQRKGALFTRGSVVTESHDLFLDGGDATLYAELLGPDRKCNIT